MIDSQSVSQKTFAVTKFREGYDQDQITGFLGQVAATLSSYERPTVLGGASRLTGDDVVNSRFQPTKFRAGFDQDEVDNYLDEIVATLRQHEQNTVRATQLPPPAV